MRNPVLPYALIAVLGIFTIIIVSYFGVGHREAMLNPEETESAVSQDPQDIYNANSCLGCHGSELTGGAGGPDISQVGSKLTEEEIHQIIMEGKGPMPGGLVTEAQAEILTEWLSGME